MKYLWTEDTGAGLHFWKLLNQLFFENAFVVESKESNQGILDALLSLEIKADDKYYIAFDYVVDNQDIRNKYRMLKSIAEKSEGTGAAATGKTTSFSIMSECMAVNSDIVCINYQDYHKDIKKLIAGETGKLKKELFIVVRMWNTSCFM